MTTDLWPTVHVLRHGQTAWNLTGRMQGHTDVALDETGRSQALVIAERLRGVPIARIVASDLVRSLETARAVGAVCGVEPTIDLRLREQNLGWWEGKTFAEAQAGDPELAERFRAYDPEARPPSGETRAELSTRIWAAFCEHAAPGSAGPLLIVSHGGAIQALINRVLGVPPSTTRRFLLHNVGLTTFVRRGDAWFLRTLNDISHHAATSTDRFPFE